MKLVTDPRTRESRGFGFVGFETPEQATAAMDALNNAEIDGRKIIVEKVHYLILILLLPLCFSSKPLSPHIAILVCII